ncbi:MAG: hemolysin III family protein, partial [Bacteroidota bacterium]
DHVAIFILIAGTYTPLALIILAGDVGDIIFYVIWTIATLGTILKLFFTGKYNIVSTILYVLMGWVVIFAIRPLVQSMSVEGLFWVFTGGASYTLGAIIYSIDRIQFNHAIFHLFVLGGSFCHFMAMYFCVL